MKTNVNLKKLLSYLLTIVIAFSLCSCEDSNKVNEYNWPTSKIANLLPQPKSKIGDITFDSEDMFTLDVYKTSEKQFEAYVNACKSNGFTVDYVGFENYYSAYNADGYNLMLSLYDEVLSISIFAPIETNPSAESTETSEIEKPTETEQSTETEQPNKVEQATESQQSIETEQSTEASSELVDGMRPEFKEAMDSYEEFFDEYCAFMKKYKDSNNAISLLGDYTNYMTKYVDMTEKMNEWNSDEEMTNEELKYYIEVTGRINQKLLDISM